MIWLKAKLGSLPSLRFYNMSVYDGLIVQIGSCL